MELYVSFQGHRMEPMTWHLPHAEPLREWLLFESIEAHPSESAVEAFSEGISCHTPSEFTARNDNSENCPGLMCPDFPSYASKKSPKSADPKLRKHMETNLPGNMRQQDSLFQRCLATSYLVTTQPAMDLIQSLIQGPWSALAMCWVVATNCLWIAK